MNEVQLTLLFLGLFVILIMLIHNWIQLKKHNKNENKANKSSKTSEITDENDPLFNLANPIFEREKSLDPKSEGSTSEHLITENLPNGNWCDYFISVKFYNLLIFLHMHQNRIFAHVTQKPPRYWLILHLSEITICSFSYNTYGGGVRVATHAYLQYLLSN